jgi:hypothetical protein
LTRLEVFNNWLSTFAHVTPETTKTTDGAARIKQLQPRDAVTGATLSKYTAGDGGNATLQHIDGGLFRENQ